MRARKLTFKGVVTNKTEVVSPSGQSPFATLTIHTEDWGAEDFERLQGAYGREQGRVQLQLNMANVLDLPLGAVVRVNVEVLDSPQGVRVREDHQDEAPVRDPSGSPLQGMGHAQSFDTASEKTVSTQRKHACCGKCQTSTPVTVL